MKHHIKGYAESLILHLSENMILRNILGILQYYNKKIIFYYMFYYLLYQLIRPELLRG